MCHSLDPGRHLTGPSLARIVGRKAATVEGFDRYSDALRRAPIEWTEATLDRFLANPQAIVPKTVMAFPGIESAAERTDLIAFLKAAGAGERVPAPPHGPRPHVDLRQVTPDYRVRAIRYCGDAYYVTTESGDTYPYWEYNLRFKTDSTEKGPEKGSAVLLPAGMQGDRAYVVFAGPEEISGRIRRTCAR
jgi:cytochrome c